MSVPLLPGPFGQIGNSAFSFYPPLLGVERTEWKYLRATWSELIVANADTGEEAWIPRNFVGDVSFNGPTIIVGLTRDLELRGQVAVPYRRPVVEIPLAVNDVPVARRATPAPVVNIRLETHAPVHVRRKAVVLVMLGVVAAAIVGGILRPGFNSVFSAHGRQTSWQKRSGAVQFHPVPR